jgi:hypothetical protein
METSTIHSQRYPDYSENALNEGVTEQRTRNQLRFREPIPYNGNPFISTNSSLPHTSSDSQRSAVRHLPAQKNPRPSSQRPAGAVASSNKLQLSILQQTNKRSRENTGSETGEGIDETDSEADSDKAADIAERRALGKRGRKRAAPSAHSRTVRLDKYGPAGPFVYECLQANVCAELVRTRYCDC